MKIGIDIRNIGKGRTGDEVVFFNLVKNLSQIDSQNEYLLFTDRQLENDSSLGAEIEKLELKENFKIVSLGNQGVNKFIWNFWTLPQYLKKNPVDIYQTQYIVPFFVDQKTKIITIIHDVSFKVFPELIKLTDRILLSIFIPLSLKRADKIMTISRFSAEEIAKYYPFCKEKIAWTYNAIGDEFKDLEFSSEELEEIENNYKLPKKFILYLGTLQPRKNLPILIKAFAKISSEFPELHLVLAGGRGYNFDQRIDAEIRKNGLKDRVLFPGFILNEDKPKFYKLAEIFCFPSLYEGFGIPILEAFILGTPVIASRIPPHMEIAGNAALLFEPGKEEVLAKQIKTLLADQEEKESYIKKGFEQAATFSWQKAAQDYLEIYKNLN